MGPHWTPLNPVRRFVTGLVDNVVAMRLASVNSRLDNLKEIIVTSAQDTAAAIEAFKGRVDEATTAIAGRLSTFAEQVRELTESLEGAQRDAVLNLLASLEPDVAALEALGTGSPADPVEPAPVEPGDDAAPSV